MAPQCRSALLAQILFPYLPDEALYAILQWHLHGAVNSLVKGQGMRLDPAIGDASCMMRPSILVDMYSTVRQAFIQNGTLASSEALVASYERAHANDKPDTRISSLDDLNSRRDPEGYQALLGEVGRLVGKQGLVILSLSSFFTTVYCRDEFGSPFSSRTKTFSYPGCGDRGSQAAMVARLRSELASACMAAFDNMAKESTSRLGQQAQQATQRMRSRIVQPDSEHDIDLVAIYPQFRTILAHEFRKGRPIAITVRRIEVRSGAQYALTDARALLFKPNVDSGRFEISASDDGKEPCLSVNCWSTYSPSSQGTGLQSSSNDEYFDALACCDVSWLLLTYAAAHPAFTQKAEHQQDWAATYKSLGSDDSTFEYSRGECVGFSIGERSKPHLCEEWKMATEVGKRFTLADAQLIPTHRGEGNACYHRTSRQVDFSVEHAQLLSWNECVAFCDGLKRKHLFAKAAVGQFIARSGSCGLSCADEVFANGLAGVGNESRRKKMYFAMYPANRALWAEVPVAARI